MQEAEVVQEPADATLENESAEIPLTRTDKRHRSENRHPWEGYSIILDDM
jgi:hypothetical protein